MPTIPIRTAGGRRNARVCQVSIEAMGIVLECEAVILPVGGALILGRNPFFEQFQIGFHESEKRCYLKTTQ